MFTKSISDFATFGLMPGEHANPRAGPISRQPWKRSQTAASTFSKLVQFAEDRNRTRCKIMPASALRPDQPTSLSRHFRKLGSENLSRKFPAFDE